MREREREGRRGEKERETARGYSRREVTPAKKSNKRQGEKHEYQIGIMLTYHNFKFQRFKHSFCFP